MTCMLATVAPSMAMILDAIDFDAAADGGDSDADAEIEDSHWVRDNCLWNRTQSE